MGLPGAEDEAKPSLSCGVIFIHRDCWNGAIHSGTSLISTSPRIKSLSKKQLSLWDSGSN